MYDCMMDLWCVLSHIPSKIKDPVILSAVAVTLMLVSLSWKNFPLGDGLATTMGLVASIGSMLKPTATSGSMETESLKMLLSLSLSVNVPTESVTRTRALRNGTTVVAMAGSVIQSRRMIVVKMRAGECDKRIESFMMNPPWD